MRLDEGLIIPAELENGVKYVANELLENAMKYSNGESGYKNRFALHMYEKRLVFKVTNSVSTEQASKLHGMIQNMLAHDPQELYMAQMEASAGGDDGQVIYSGLGFLSMVCDYSAILGWEFASAEPGEPATEVVTTMVSLDF